MSPGGEEWCLLSLGELGGIPVTVESFAGPLAVEESVTSMYEDSGSGCAALRWFSRFINLSFCGSECIVVWDIS